MLSSENNKSWPKDIGKIVDVPNEEDMEDSCDEMIEDEKSVRQLTVNQSFSVSNIHQDLNHSRSQMLITSENNEPSGISLDEFLRLSDHEKLSHIKEIKTQNSLKMSSEGLQILFINDN